MHYKAQESSFSVVPIAFDRTSTNSKVVRKLLKVLNFTLGGKSVLLAELKLETYFIRKEKKNFVLFALLK